MEKSEVSIDARVTKLENEISKTVESIEKHKKAVKSLNEKLIDLHRKKELAEENALLTLLRERSVGYKKLLKMVELFSDEELGEAHEHQDVEQQEIEQQEEPDTSESENNKTAIVKDDEKNHTENDEENIDNIRSDENNEDK